MDTETVYVRRHASPVHIRGGESVGWQDGWSAGRRGGYLATASDSSIAAVRRVTRLAILATAF